MGASFIFLGTVVIFLNALLTIHAVVKFHEFLSDGDRYQQKAKGKYQKLFLELTKIFISFTDYQMPNIYIPAIKDSGLILSFLVQHCFIKTKTITKVLSEKHKCFARTIYVAMSNLSLLVRNG